MEIYLFCITLILNKPDHIFKISCHRHNSLVFKSHGLKALWILIGKTQGTYHFLHALFPGPFFYCRDKGMSHLLVIITFHKNKPSVFLVLDLIIPFVNDPHDPTHYLFIFIGQQQDRIGITE